MSQATKERIMFKAIDMFNKKSATNVSTVQLANELKMSPGNLYYYFDNKEHLIRTIWMELLAPQIGELFFEKELEEKVEGLMSLFNHLSRYTYDYRFFYLELPALLHNDPETKEIYVERSRMLMDRMRSVIEAWISKGIMNPMSSTAITLLVQNCWVMSQTAITYLNTLDSAVSAKEIRNGITQRLYGLLHPYFSEESRQKMATLFEDNGFPLPA